MTSQIQKVADSPKESVHPLDRPNKQARRLVSISQIFGGTGLILVGFAIASSHGWGTTFALVFSITLFVLGVLVFLPAVYFDRLAEKVIRESKLGVLMTEELHKPAIASAWMDYRERLRRLCSQPVEAGRDDPEYISFVESFRSELAKCESRRDKHLREHETRLSQFLRKHYRASRPSLAVQTLLLALCGGTAYTIFLLVRVIVHTLI